MRIWEGEDGGRTIGALSTAMRGVGEILPRSMSIEIDQWAQREALFYKGENRKKKTL